MNPTWNSNLDLLLPDSDVKNIPIKTIIKKVLTLMKLNDWRGACHESCGVMYVLFTELGIECQWRLGEVYFTTKKIQGYNVCFDHSWIEYDGRKIDLAIYKTHQPQFDMSPTIMDLNIETLQAPELRYDTNSGWGDDFSSTFVKNTRLSQYFDNSPIDPKIGTWKVILDIAKELGLQLDLAVLRQKYNDIFWK